MTKSENGVRSNINITSEVASAARFGVIGLLAAGIHVAVAQALLWLSLAAPFVANASGFATSFVFAGLGHYYYSFAAKSPIWRSLYRYGLIALTGFAINSTILVVLLREGSLDEWVALLIAILIVPAGSWLLSRLWAFV